MLTAILGVAACACGSDGAVQSAADAEIAWPPAECDGFDTPFADEACLDQLRNVCRSHRAESDCLGQGPAAIGDLEPADFRVSCNWVPIVTFSDGTSCEVESTSWRCEAYVEMGLDVCADPCEADFGLHYAWKAIPTEREMVKMCGVPLGSWSVIGNDSRHVSTCARPGALVTPPNPPLCDCVPAACEATRGLFADPMR